ncbi:MFS transporter [Phenylobacterium sp. J426]|uniref:MFS transporter n=1 Tax=Phenylobacterium sp. J426 TaxID=2898439 RepID=UPI0021514855|nr:MFS transporter [Phenylobacterium sp. J426]
MGVFLGATVGGWAAIQFGWRGAFFLVAGVGLAAAALLVLLVREPVRGGLDRGYAAKPAAAMSLPASARLFLSKPTLRILLVASGLAAFVSTGMLNWIPAYLMRVQQMPLAEVARWFGPAAGLCMGGRHLGRRRPGELGRPPESESLCLDPRPLDAADRAHPGAGLFGSLLADLARADVRADDLLHDVRRPALALVQNLSPVAARATATSLLLLAFNILGPGGGPLAIGMMSDGFAAAGAAQPLKLALIATAPIALVSALLYARLARVVDADTRKVLEET